jgi:hypothetical protein
MAPKRAPVSSSVTKSAIENASLSLTDLPEKQKEELSLREAIQHMYESISGALSKGYSLEEVADLLNDQGVAIGVPSLKYYLTRGIKKPTTRKTRTRRKAQVKSESAVEMSDAETAEVTPAKTPKRSTGARSKTTTAAKVAPATKARAKTAEAKPASRGTKAKPVAKTKTTATRRKAQG